MFNSITWGQYFTTVGLLLVCYYAFIGFRYYCWEVLSIIGIKKVDDNAIAISTVANFKKSFQTERHQDYIPKPALEDHISLLATTFTDEVKAYLQESDSGITKDELLHSIQEIIIKYPVLKDSDHKSEVAEFIFNESNAKYPNLFQLNDLEQLLN